MLARLLWTLLATTLATTLGVPGGAQAADAGGGGAAPASLFVPATSALALLARGATVLDARERGFVWGHIPGAQPVDWRDFRDGWGRTGRLHPDPAQMAARLSALGVAGDRPVLIYGDAGRGFGEEGRIAWLLAYLGHRQVYILDGGWPAWGQVGGPIARGLAGRPVRPEGPGIPFVPSPQPGLRTDKAAVQRVVQGLEGAPRPTAPLILDVRTAAEWRGATPYFEARGGHIPSARHLDWQQLLGSDGRLRSAAELHALLSSLGVAPPAGHSPASDASPAAEPDIVVYCTGGVRSAFVWAVLRSLGYRHVRNYDGSFWEWAADPSLPVTRPPGPSP